MAPPEETKVASGRCRIDGRRLTAVDVVATTDALYHRTLIPLGRGWVRTAWTDFDTIIMAPGPDGMAVSFFVRERVRIVDADSVTEEAASDTFAVDFLFTDRDLAAAIDLAAATCGVHVTVYPDD